MPRMPWVEAEVQSLSAVDQAMLSHLVRPLNVRLPMFGGGRTLSPRDMVCTNSGGTAKTLAPYGDKVPRLSDSTIVP